MTDLLRSFCLFFNWVVCFLTTESWEFIMYSGCRSFIRYRLGQYFFLACDLCFCSLTSVFQRAEFLILMKSDVSTFPFIDCTLGVTSKKSLPNPVTKVFFKKGHGFRFYVWDYSPLWVNVSIWDEVWIKILLFLFFCMWVLNCVSIIF